MVFGENNIDNFYNSQSDFFDKEDDMLNDVYRIFRDINNQNPTTIETVYTSFFNDDDEKIPDFIIAEFEDSLKEDTVTRDKPYTPQKPSQSSQINTQPIHITSTNIDPLSNRWELISIIEKIVTGLYASIYITLQKYNNNYYVVLTKISNRYNPRHCALPISVADFIADCIWDALQNKENINTQTPTSRKQ